MRPTVNGLHVSSSRSVEDELRFHGMNAAAQRCEQVTSMSPVTKTVKCLSHVS